MSKSIPVLMITIYASLLTGLTADQDPSDPYLWLESIEGEKSLEWVRAQNDSTMAALTLGSPFQGLYEKNLKVYNSLERIAYPDVHGRFVYNFWKDERNERGLWRRTTVQEYRKANPVWEVVLDIDSLSKAESENWVFAGADFLRPQCDRCMLSLSRGGADASVIREFDLRTKRFVEGGFALPESKGGTSWKDENTLLVSSGLTKDEVTTSGYPRVTKIWKRGTPVQSATSLFAADTTDLGAWVYSIYTPERQYILVAQALTIFKSTVFAVEEGNLIKLDIPTDANLVTILQGRVILWLKTEWHVGDNTFAQGSLVGVDYDELLHGRKSVHAIWTPTGKSCISSVSNTRNLLLVNTLNNVRGDLLEGTYRGGTWSFKRVAAPEFGTIEVVDTDL
ncbi:MAG TPA: S9 family peptidase, partial [Bacteroidota bacterium]|nr:S9 family peptidase [Bacteroidota bacterium]